MSDHTNVNTLSYYIPNRNKRKTILRIPESHSLHVCPSACGRRNAIRAIKNGEKEFMSFLYISETDLVSGHYEEIIGDAIDTLLQVLHPIPKAFVIYFNCIDDFLGTDEKALLDRLRIRYSSLRFTVCHIDPVAADERIPPGMRKHNQMYEFLEHTGKKDDGINLLGNYVSLDKECELFDVLSGWGIHTVRQLFECKTYSEYQEMADSSLNLVLMRMGCYAAENMVKKLGIPYYFNPITYDIDEVVSNYRNIAGILGKPCPDFDAEIYQTKLVIRATREIIGDMPVIVDSSATMLPFALAKVLFRSGFNVTAVFAPLTKNEDTEEQAWLTEHAPQLRAVQEDSFEAVAGYGFDRECIAIGYDSAYLLQANHFVDIYNDETFYGFHGIQKLMSLMRKAYETKTAW
jgi:nitrogenase molybdenum-iron protein alpha/beta subunit